MDERPPAEDRIAGAQATYPAAVRALLLEVLSIRDGARRARWIGELHADKRSRAFTELLADIEEDAALRAPLVGMLREDAWGR